MAIPASNLADASMGPPPFGSGNQTCFAVSVTTRTLQWGHRLSAVETGLQQHGYASPEHGFNGATAFRQWKPATTGKTREPSTSCFNGATAFRQWKHDGSIRGFRIPICFNGATAFRQWKPHRRDREVGDFIASMGPPPFGSGNFSWRHSFSPNATLQWGHRLSAVETRDTRTGPDRPHWRFNGATAFRQWKLGTVLSFIGGFTASMGPPPFGSGNGCGVRRIAHHSVRFNGATAFRQWKQPIQSKACSH